MSVSQGMPVVAVIKARKNESVMKKKKLHSRDMP
jgi:hypothetical protein